jgi:drug/metabolite transporter (DMT)-like permease
VAGRLSGEPAAVRPGAGESGGLSGRGLILLVALTVAWGVNWPMMKMALQEIPPWSFRTLCLMVGGATLLLLTRAAGQKVLIPPRYGLAIAWVALFNITGWHICSAYGLLHTGSGRAAIIGYTMPLWTSLFSIPILGTRPNARQVLALTLGMGALATLVAEDFRALGGAPLGALFMIGAALNFAMGTVLVKKVGFSDMPVMALTGWQQLIGGLPIVVGWLLLEPVPDLTAVSWPALLGLLYAIFIAMVFCHTAYFQLVRLLPAHVAAIGILAVPVVGVISGAIMLGEPIGQAEITALVLVVGGLCLLNWRR